MTYNKKNTIIISTTIIILTVLYFFTVLIFRRVSTNLKANELGDYVSGILTPYFTLLSTVAIIFLTHTIAQNDNKKADEAITTQKRITLNQMRQSALDNLISKLNMFAYEIDKMKIHEVKEGSYVQKILTANIEKQDTRSNLVWLITLCEIDSFLQLEYLFGGLFQTENFQITTDLLTKIVGKIIDQNSSIKMLTAENISTYIETKQEFVTKIGNFILSEF